MGLNMHGHLHVDIRVQSSALLLHNPSCTTLPAFFALFFGNEQAGSSRLQPRGGSTPAAGTPAAARGTLQPASAISLTEPGHRLARDLPFGAGHGQAELAMDPLPAPPFPWTPAGEVIQPPPPALPPEAWPCECNTNKAKRPKRDKVFLNTTHC